MTLLGHQGFPYGPGVHRVRASDSAKNLKCKQFPALLRGFGISMETVGLSFRFVSFWCQVPASRLRTALGNQQTRINECLCRFLQSLFDPALRCMKLVARTDWSVAWCCRSSWEITGPQHHLSTITRPGPEVLVGLPRVCPRGTPGNHHGGGGLALPNLSVQEEPSAASVFGLRLKKPRLLKTGRRRVDTIRFLGGGGRVL